MQLILSTSLVVFIKALCLCNAASAQNTVTATCLIVKNSGIAPIEGTVDFSQPESGGNVTIKVYLTGFDPSTTITKHGFHVHENGDLSDSCSAAGGHYNPAGVVHGGPEDSVRHVGDLGNVEAVGEPSAVVDTTIVDHVVSLIGGQSIIGRAIVVHEGEDDLGKGGHADSKTTGHAGARYGCCTITASRGSVHVFSLSSGLVVAVLCLLFNNYLLHV